MKESTRSRDPCLETQYKLYMYSTSAYSSGESEQVDGVW
jgi:hypothetical protein